MAAWTERLRAARRRRREAQPPRRPPRPRPTTTRGELKQRVPIAIVAIALAIIVIAQGGITFTVALIALGWVCMFELFAMYDTAPPARLAAFAALAAMLLAANYGGLHQLLLMMALAVPLVFLATAGTLPGGGNSIAVALLAIYYIGLALAHAVLLINLPHGDGIVVSVLIGTFVGDTGAYLGGRTLGRTKLAPRISPAKTVEGLVIGIVFGVAAVWFAGVYQDYISGLQALLLGAVVCVVAPVGDLFASYLKRDTGVKDTGTLFGAHGGALDRLDAALFTGVAGYFVWAAMLS